MEQVSRVLEWVTLIAFCALAVLSARLYFKLRNAASKWLALTFTSLGVIAIAGRFTPEESPSDLVLWVQKVEIAILVLFPYFLFRFGMSFRPPGRTLKWLAAGLTLLVIGWTFSLSDLPAQGEARSTSYSIWIAVLLVQWTALSLIVTWWLWTGGRGQPELARRRMRMLGVAAALLSFALILAGAAGGGEEGTGIQVSVQLIALLSALTFYLGFAPPTVVRMVWRRESEEALRRAVTDLLTAQTDDEVTTGLLPHTASIVGGGAVALTDENGDLAASHNASQEMLAILPELLGETGDADGRVVSGDCLRLRFPFGSLVVWSTPYTPFFGQEEIDLLESLGTLAHLALERTRAAKLRSRLQEAHLRREQALEINDNIVQGLAIAKYAFDLGRNEQARDAINDTLAAARSIISDLLEEIAPGAELEPGRLVREGPAHVPRVDSEGREEQEERSSTP